MEAVVVYFNALSYTQIKKSSVMIRTGYIHSKLVYSVTAALARSATASRKEQAKARSV
jgi:hypothetical protein